VSEGWPQLADFVRVVAGYGLSSTQQESAPQYSPDGTRIAFQSLRSGTQEIWVCRDGGTDLVRLTSFGGPLTGSPNWSPDGQQIVFDSRPEGHSHIYVIGLNGGQPRAVTHGDYNDIVPSWSRDGHWIYFGSNRSGSWQIWKVPAVGGQPQQVTKQGGFVGVESSDGKWLFYAKGDQPGIWQVPTQGGEEAQILKQPAVGDWGYWNVWKDSIYYLDTAGNTTVINAFNTTTRRTTRVYTLERTPPPFAGITVAPDGKSLIFTDLTEAGSHITLVENFR